MKVLKEGGHRLFETDPEISRYVEEMLSDLEKNGMEAVQISDDFAPPAGRPAIPEDCGKASS